MPIVIPSKKLTIEALQHLNVTSNLLYSTRISNWKTTMTDEDDNYLTVGEVLMRLKARVVQGLGVPEEVTKQIQDAIESASDDPI